MNRDGRAAKLIVVLMSITFGLVVAEIALQLSWRSDVGEMHRETHVLRAGETVEVGGIEYELNSLGLRDREFDADRDTGTVVLTLGDSFVFGYGISRHDLVSTQLELRLGGVVGSVRVINAGRNGFDTQDEYRELVRLAPLLKPDGVLVFFFTNDVLFDNQEGTLSRRHRLKEYLRRNLRLAELLYSFWKGQLAGAVGVPKFMLAPGYFDFSNDNEGWVEFRAATRAIAAYCERQDVALMFVLIPTLTGLNSRYPYNELRSAVRTHLKSENIPYVDLFEVFAGTEPSQLWVSRHNTHWNVTGTAMAADALTEVLLSSWQDVWRSTRRGEIE